MGTKSIRLFWELLLLTVSCVCNAQYAHMNTDEKTIKQAAENAAAISIAEEAHNVMVDSIKKKQSKLRNIVTTIATNKVLHEEVLKNVKGFGTESRIYKSMVSTGADIVNNSLRAVDLIKNSNLTQKAVVTIEVGKLVSSACEKGKIFADIVTNATVKNPIPSDKASTKKDGDKKNLLNRDERLSLAITLLQELKDINSQITYICYLAKYSTLRDLIKAIDSTTWYNYLYARINVNDIIQKWNQLKD